MRVVKCKGCGARIFFAKTDKGKSIPVEAEPERRLVIVEQGELFQGYTLPNVKVVLTYVSHFATCPEAVKFRKRREVNGNSF